jgi:16S rRNA (cytosine1402-N4)-methyltransferase
VIAIDADTSAIAFAQADSYFQEQLNAGRLILIHTNFSNLDRVLRELHREPPCLAGALFDLGMSSDQIEESGRGFSFNRDEPLDMRMNEELGVTAADLVNALPEKHLKNLFWEYAQESAASQIAHAIVTQREHQPFRTSQQLADLVSRVKHGRQGSHLHPATKAFMALRMAVNSELDNLRLLLDQILPWMLPAARLVFISFHEGEDRLIKQQFRLWEQQGKTSLVTLKPLAASEAELQNNPRSRSAQLRAMEII